VLDRLVNIFLFFTLVFIFLLVAKVGDHVRITLAFVLAITGSFLAFILNWLTLDGVLAAILFGVVAYGLGDLTGAAVVVSFFISSSLISKDLISEESLLDKKFRRNGLQVWSNGFWFAIWTIIWFMTKEHAFLIAAVASISFATADTWASEIGGHRVKGKTWMLTTFKKVKPGTDGGISIIGTVASLTGAFFIGAIYWLVNAESSWYAFLLIALSGFTGSFIDSLFGAVIQGKRFNLFFHRLFARQISYVDNNMVNWLASGSASIIALLIVLVTGH
jgi:uncharacterized protein (TIGR00297 family)